MAAHAARNVPVGVPGDLGSRVFVVEGGARGVEFGREYCDPGYAVVFVGGGAPLFWWGLHWDVWYYRRWGGVVGFCDAVGVARTCVYSSEWD